MANWDRVGNITPGDWFQDSATVPFLPAKWYMQTISAATNRSPSSALSRLTGRAFLPSAEGGTAGSALPDRGPGGGAGSGGAMV